MSSYKTTCPKCGGNDFYCTTHNGFCYCFHCSHWTRTGDGDSEREHIRGDCKTIREFYRFASNYYHSSMTEDVRRYLHARGITDALIDRFQVGYAPSGHTWLYELPEAREAGLALTSGEATLANRITFPYFYNGEIVDIRGRTLNPREEIKYKSPYHPAYYRWADYPYNANDLAAVRPVITEGEIKTILSVAAGVPTIGLPGMLSWKPAIKLRRAVILFDSQKDPRIRRYVQLAIDKAAREISDPYVATLPLHGRDKTDIDDYILMYGERAYREDVVNLAVQYDTWRQLVRR